MAGFLSTLASPLLTLVDRLIPDKAANDAAKATLAQMDLSGELAQVMGQLQINATEAQSRSVFVSGWRPFVGWVCGFGLCYQFLFMPLANGISAAFHHPFLFPPLDTNTLLYCLGGMLGLGGLRTAEKVAGVAAT